jgi:flagella basal body P-ring formation protein FlgA
MASHFRRALLAWLWLCAAGIAAEINLRDSATVDHAVVRLGDLADLYDVTDAEREAVLATELFPAPAAGSIEKLSVRELQEVLARRSPELASWTFSGASEVAVSRRAEHKPREPQKTQPKKLTSGASNRVKKQLEQAILGYVRERLGDSAWNVETELTDAQVTSLAAAKSIRVTGGRYLDAERVQFRVEISEATAAEILKVDATVSLPPMIVVAARDLNRGELITEHDVELVHKEELRGAQPAFASIADAVGKETTRAIAAGQPISESSVRATLMVRRGQVVTVYSRCGGVQIRTTGRAKEDGSLGSLVPVESIGSRETFHARVSGHQEVEIFAGVPEVPAVEDTPREPTPWLANRQRQSAAVAEARRHLRPSSVK